MKRTVSFSKESSNIFFHILTDCNLRCIHCYINREQHGSNSLSLPEIEEWLGLFAEKDKNTNLVLLGGEPTLHPDLPLAIKKARSLGYSSITVDTNGYLFNSILNKIGPDEVDFFSFSIDGATRTTSDMIRGKGSYDRCMAGIRDAVKKGFNTSVIYTVSSLNIDELEMMPPLLERLGVDRFFIQVIGVRGNSVKKAFPATDRAKINKTRIQVARALWTEIIPEVAEKTAELGITVTYPKVFLNSEDNFECAGLVADNYFIFPNGRVYRCPLCEDFPMHSMMIKENRLIKNSNINESHLFKLNIPEGCVMNRIIQSDNLEYKINGTPEFRVACCMLKEEVMPQ
jgi:MoaA/NifB/PqqE/SkfB family radical SAM enzyme